MSKQENRLFKRIMKHALRMQDRFAAEPVLARTGKGFLKSEGVETWQRIRAGMKSAPAKRTSKLPVKL